MYTFPLDNSMNFTEPRSLVPRFLGIVRIQDGLIRIQLLESNTSAKDNLVPRNFGEASWITASTDPGDELLLN